MPTSTDYSYNIQSILARYHRVFSSFKMPTTKDYSYHIRFILVRYRPIHEDQSLSFDDPFHVDLRIWYTRRDQHAVPINMIMKEAPLHHGQLKSHDTARLALTPLLSILSTTGIDVNDQTVNDISDCAMALSSVSISCGPDHGLLVPGIQLLFIDATNTVGPGPSIDSCIEVLERLVLVHDGGWGSMDWCAICLEDVGCAGKVAQMPCSHVYHGDCIIEWLKMSDLCPLCRYQMPAFNFFCRRLMFCRTKLSVFSDNIYISSL
ncbi:uncharacterized protein LOC131298708 [Rhododendron vialii]|uniref:uncharacterized protein LOC131298708 n=1 Tax=Rhododendron vialii TaxID=182163 RepID=UPI00265F6DBE|nr:uncharacterized protein LOC131298708 [Rhododendron vialii]